MFIVFLLLLENFYTDAYWMNVGSGTVFSGNSHMLFLDFGLIHAFGNKTCCPKLKKEDTKGQDSISLCMVGAGLNSWIIVLPFIAWFLALFSGPVGGRRFMLLSAFNAASLLASVGRYFVNGDVTHTSPTPKKTRDGCFHCLFVGLFHRCHCLFKFG